MPPKGYLSLGEDLITVATRLPASMLQAVDEHITVLHAQAPWARVNRTDALRDLVHRGLQQAQQVGDGSRVEGSTSTGPALLGLEQTAPAPDFPPVPTPQVARIFPSPQGVEDATAVPVAALQASIDRATPDAGDDEAATRLAQLRERNRRNSAAFRARKREGKASR